MKIAPLDRAFRNRKEVEHIIVHTGQHYDRALSDVFFEQLGISDPKFNLGIGSYPREEQIERIMEAFEPVVASEKPDLVLVVGDVNSTVACSRVAVKHGVKVAHVEAGLRSFDMDMPEEVNRIETDEISDFLFVTEESGVTNLQKEKIKGQVHLVGNVMIDTLVRSLGLVDVEQSLKDLGVKAKEFSISTFHRPSNVDAESDLLGVINILKHVASYGKLVFPVHPRTRASLEKYGYWGELQEEANLICAAPQSYFDFIALINSATMVVTDSGGIQEETTFLKVPCITMRDNTERPVTVDIGTNYLAGTKVDNVKKIVDEVAAGKGKSGVTPQFWDGNTAERIADILLSG